MLADGYTPQQIKNIYWYHLEKGGMRASVRACMRASVRVCMRVCLRRVWARMVCLRVREEGVCVVVVCVGGIHGN